MTDLFKRFGSQSNPQIGMIKQAFGLIKNAGNPQAMFMQMVQNNPAYQKAMNYIQQNGGNAENAFYNYASQHNVSESDANDIINMFH